jgi:hypothetical protein
LSIFQCDKVRALLRENRLLLDFFGLIFYHATLMLDLVLNLLELSKICCLALHSFFLQLEISFDPPFLFLVLLDAFVTVVLLSATGNSGLMLSVTDLGNYPAAFGFRMVRYPMTARCALVYSAFELRITVRIRH